MNNKNIWILPTDKPSSLFIIDKSKMFLSEPPYLSFSPIGGRVHKVEGSELYQPQNMYITSNVEIKGGDYFISNLNEILKCTKKEDKFVWYERLTVPGVSKIAQPFSIHVNLNPKKIIFTTDEELIANGVQAIDNEFLQWFVQNPSCEWAELGFMSNITSTGTNRQYKIIIPQESERMYSEEELKSAFKIGFNIGYGSPVSELDLKNEHCEKWFNQFKKK